MVGTAPAEWYEPVLDAGLLPDFVVREGIKYLISQRAKSAAQLQLEELQAEKLQFVKDLKEKPIAIETQKANEQHYEVPTEFIRLCLGTRMKYSCCLFPPGISDLNDAEELMLESYCEKARLHDGLEILELGCGWGSLCLYLAQRYPASRITAVSNSKTQKEYIDAAAESAGISNLQVITADVNVYESAERYDRIVSIEMLEHMKNYMYLFQRISSWLKDDGLFFCHVFSHKSLPYHFETDEGNSWMARYFFTGGTMPSHDLFLYFQDSMAIEGHWFVNGSHYGKTSEAWLKNMDKHRLKALKILAGTYGDDASIWFNRWRIFYLSVAELFSFNKGTEWGVSHFLFKKK